MLWLYPNINAVVSQQGFATQCGHLLPIHSKIEKGEPLNLETQLRLGTVLESTQTWSIMRFAVSVFSCLSTTWRQAYLLTLADFFIVATRTNNLPPFFKRSFTEKQLQTEVNLMALWNQVKAVLEAKIKQEPFMKRPTALIAKIKNETEIIAYYKQSRENSMASAIMERFVWDCAVRLKVEDLFTPTKIAPRSLIKIEGSTVKGSLQPALKGLTLADWIDTEKTTPIDFNEIMKASMAILVFGFYDAHSDNIFIDENNRPAFFDNARCFGPGEIIKYGNSIIPSTRSGLFELNSAYQELTADDRNFLKTQLTHYLENVDLLYQYLLSPLTRLRLKRLPPNWLEPTKVVASTKERLARLEKGLSNPSVKCLRDLFFAVYPRFRFIAAISLTRDTKKEMDDTICKCWKSIKKNTLGLQKFILGAIGGGGYDLRNLVCGNPRIDPFFVWNLCQDPKLSFEEVIHEMSLRIDLNAKESNLRFSQNGIKILQLLSSAAVEDRKI